MLLYVLNMILLPLPFIVIRVAIRYLLGDFSFPSFKRNDGSELPDNQKDCCELPDKQKDFIQLN